MKLILGGHHTPAPAGWTVLTEEQCDIRRRLPWERGEVDAIFTEHVLEHLQLPDAVTFFWNVADVLKLGGVFRCVTPTIEALERMMRGFLDGDTRDYARTSLLPIFNRERVALAQLELSIEDCPAVFIYNSIFLHHGHQFIWSENLLKVCLLKVGFSEVRLCSIGMTYSGVDVCHERRRRGVFNQEGPNFDLESSIVEAIR